MRVLLLFSAMIIPCSQAIRNRDSPESRQRRSAYYLGWLLHTTGEIKPAITQFETAIRLKPSLAEPT
jgi:hypothetical protein